MMRVTIRLLTAIALIVASGVAVAEGWGIVRFSLASTNIVSSEKRARTADAWRATSGVISTVLNDELADETSQSDIIAAYRQRELASAILSIKPLSSMDWLALSKAELMTHQPMEDVFRSLKLSMLTGPNEGYVMGERAVFAVSLWDGLPADLERHAAVDVAATMFPRTPQRERCWEKFGPPLPHSLTGCETRYRSFPERDRKAIGILAFRLRGCGTYLIVRY
jgi:hypothetical protein